MQAGMSRVLFPMAPWHCGTVVTQPLTEMSTRNISLGGKGGMCVGLKTLLLSCADYHEIWQP
jgi:hypothetical protein